MMNRKETCLSAAPLAVKTTSNNAASQSCDGSDCKRTVASRGSSDPVFL